MSFVQKARRSRVPPGVDCVAGWRPQLLRMAVLTMACVVGVSCVSTKNLPTTSPAPTFPEFPWPPPPSSATELLPEDAIRMPTSGGTLGDIDVQLSQALQLCGYVEKGYYAVPDGFAVATHLERINEDGTSMAAPRRWDMKVENPTVFDLRSYVRALFGSNVGIFRVIVFIITPQPFSQTGAVVSESDVRAWPLGGANRLPEAIAAKPVSEGCRITALTYEFSKPQYGETEQTERYKDHLARSGLEQALEGRECRSVVAAPLGDKD